MKKPDNYDTEPSVNMGEYESLEPGGYICIIKKAVVEKSKNGNEMLVILFDIHEGEKKGFYERQFNENSLPDKKWKGIFRQVTGGNSTKFFKGIIRSIEESNSGFKFDFDEKKLAGKLFGGIFGREEYFSTGKGEYLFTTKLCWIRNTDEIRGGKFQVPKDKLVNKANNNSVPSGFLGETGAVIDDDDIPF